MSNKMALDALTPLTRDETEHGREYFDAAQVRAAIAALQAEPQGWRPIETAPLFVPLQDPVPPAILYSKEYGVCMGAAGRDQFGHIYAHITNVAGSVGDIVTHFHALPATPPKD